MNGNVNIGWRDSHVAEGCVEVPDMSVINGIPPSPAKSTYFAPTTQRSMYLNGMPSVRLPYVFRT